MTPNPIKKRLEKAKRLWLFLDYDGTLAELAPTPAHIDPDPKVAELVERLAAHPQFQVAVISGRRLKHVLQLIPVSGVILAGTYGIEIQTPEGERINRVEYDQIRPTLEAIKPRWAALIAGNDDYFLEDKDWALALHARRAPDEEAESTLRAAYDILDKMVTLEPHFRLVEGYKFLEISPKLAHKGKNIRYLMEQYPWPNSLPIYLADEDKDEEAFAALKEMDGLAVLVAPEARETYADFRLESTGAVHAWLENLPEYFE